MFCEDFSSFFITHFFSMNCMINESCWIAEISLCTKTKCLEDIYRQNLVKANGLEGDNYKNTSPQSSPSQPPTFMIQKGFVSGMYKSQKSK